MSTIAQVSTEEEAPLPADEEVVVWEEIIGRDILRTIVKRGSSDESSPMGTIVKCHMNGFIYEPSGLTFVEELEDQFFKVGEGDAIPALELTLRHSHVGDIFRVRCTSKFAYGLEGRPPVKQPDGSMSLAIPPDASLEYEVEVVAHVDFTAVVGARPTGEVSNKEREIAIYEITLRKDCGNRWFSYGDYPKATRAYAKGVELAQASLEAGYEESDDEQQKRLTILYIACLNNLAACYVHRGDNLKAKEVRLCTLHITLVYSLP